jgi:hypothetical protein
MPSLSTPNCDEIDVANTLRQRSASNAARSEGALRDASEGDDRQVLPPRPILDAQLDHGAGLTSYKRMRHGARRSSRPSRARLEARSSAGPNRMKHASSAGFSLELRCDSREKG